MLVHLVYINEVLSYCLYKDNRICNEQVKTVQVKRRISEYSSVLKTIILRKLEEKYRRICNVYMLLRRNVYES